MFCLVTDNNFIECLYINNNRYYVAIYDESLNFLNNILLDSDTINFQNNERYSYFSNSISAIHLKKEIGVFAYYINNIGITEFSPLRMQINELIFEEDIPRFNNVIPRKEIIEIYTDNFNYYNNNYVRFYFESLIKINDNKYSYTYYYSESIIILIIFDLYGNNNDNIFIRYYKINTNLYNLEIYDDLKLFKYNLFLGISFRFCYASNIDIYNSFLIFGYSSKNINKISLDIYKQNQGFIYDVKNYISIDNNLFGYNLYIKISYISNSLKGIKFFSINDNKAINKNDLIDQDDHILIDFSDIKIKIGEIHTIEITWTISTDEYDKLSDYYDKIDNYGDEDYSNFYESKILEEKIFTIEFKFVCFESSKKTCNYPNLTTKIIQNYSNDIIFLSNFVYKGEENNLLNTYLALNNYDSNNYCSNDEININQYIFMNECINEYPTYYISDSSNYCNFMCENENQYIFNSKYYDSCPEGTISDLSEDSKKICKCEKLYYTDENFNNICLSSLLCDNNHPILDKNTNECLNYRVKYGNEYLYECPENTCISERFVTSRICEEKTSDMKVFNGICFNNYSLIKDKFREIVNKNKQLNDREGINLSVYSYNNYINNFDELLKNNMNSTIIDIRECLSLYKEYNNIDEGTDIYIVTVDTH